MEKKRKYSPSTHLSPSEDEDEDVTLNHLDGAFSQSEDEASDGDDSIADSASSSPEIDYEVTEDANGNERYVYREIDPVYDSDDSDVMQPMNTIGNIPLHFYDSYPHIGYDINGRKILRPATKDALDTLLDSVNVPPDWTGLTDIETGNPLKLSYEELDLIRKIQAGEADTDNPYPDTVEWFTSFEEQMPLSAAPEPKRRFLPSKHEQVRIMKLVRAIRDGRILPYKTPEEREDDEDEQVYDVWAQEDSQPPSLVHMTAPKLPPPGFDLSYNPPPEYLPSKDEKANWDQTDEEDRAKDYLPVRYNSLRQVPGWDKAVKDRFERCLDLYLAPRVQKNRLNIDPSSLLPKLPRAEELRPFPTVCQTLFLGHKGRVRSLHIDPSGLYLASGGDDGIVRVWELDTGRNLWSVRLGDEPIDTVRWRPTKDTFILAIAYGSEIFLAIPPCVDPETHSLSAQVLSAGSGYQATSQHTPTARASPVGKWARPDPRLKDEGVSLQITVKSPVKTLSWHRKGDYLCTVSPKGDNRSVAIHSLSKHLTQVPFRKLRGLVQVAHFHPLRPELFVATQQFIRCYDLQKQELVKTLQPGAKWISNFDLHSGGENVIVGSYDTRLLWHDLELSNRPFKTMRFHSRAVRAVRYHKGGLPLFADASDDGSVQIFHGKVTNDSFDNPTIVPLKVLKGHDVTESLGVLDIDWHPHHPWLVSAGADGTCRLWA
ncbi:BOP1NT domain-containing protein [Xylariales sp. AK1849]|nr:BOP1NT domain-containing protein [Xylariales sp. AK1849]